MAEKKPEARVVSEVCSMCGLDWLRHGKTPTTETCIRLLASDLAASKAREFRPCPYVVHPVYPVYPLAGYSRQYWGPAWSGTSGGQISASTTMPQLSNSVPQAVAC